MPEKRKGAHERRELVLFFRFDREDFASGLDRLEVAELDFGRGRESRDQLGQRDETIGVRFEEARFKRSTRRAQGRCRVGRAVVDRRWGDILDDRRDDPGCLSGRTERRSDSETLITREKRWRLTARLGDRVNPMKLKKEEVSDMVVRAREGRL